MWSRWTPDGVAGLARVWVAMSRSEVFPARLLGGLLGFIGKRNFLVRPDGLERLIGRHTEFVRLEDAPIPLHVVATNLLTGLDRRFRPGRRLRR